MRKVDYLGDQLPKERNIHFLALLNAMRYDNGKPFGQLITANALPTNLIERYWNLVEGLMQEAEKADPLLAQFIRHSILCETYEAFCQQLNRKSAL